MSPALGLLKYAYCGGQHFIYMTKGLRPLCSASNTHKGFFAKITPWIHAKEDFSILKHLIEMRHSKVIINLHESKQKNPVRTRTLTTLRRDPLFSSAYLWSIYHKTVALNELCKIQTSHVISNKSSYRSPSKSQSIYNYSCSK